MAKSSTMDLTTGRPIRQIFLFSLPLIAGTLFQQMYVFADTVLVARLIGSDALAAVGSASAMNVMTLGFVIGCCVGFTIPLAQAVGAKEQEQFHRYFFNGCWVSIGMSLLLTMAMVALTEPLLRLIRTPADIFADARIYITILFLGIPGGFLYNFSAGTLRAIGDSRRPTLFLLASSALNILLDYLFIAVIPLGVAGAALATVFSQLTSGLLNLWWLIAKTHVLRGSCGSCAPSVPHIRHLFRVGLPMGMDKCISNLGSVVLQGAINSLGIAAVTGQTAGEKIRQMFTLPMESVGSGMATYAGQNDGANRPDRIREGIKAGLVLQLSYCAVAWVVIFFGKEFFTEFVLGVNPGPAGERSIQYLSIMSCLFCLHGSLMIMRNTLQGMGHSGQAVFSGIFELCGRSIAGLLAVRFFGFTGICFAGPLSWGMALVYCSIMVLHHLRKRISN